MAPAPRNPSPSPVVTAVSDLKAALERAGARVDPLTAPWPELAAGLAKHLGGAFDAKIPAHRQASLWLGALVGERLRQDGGAFWFAQRDTFGALGIGFPDVVFSVSPFSVATLALIGGNVQELGNILTKIRADHGEAKSKEPSSRALTPHDYHRFFDPGFLEFVTLDMKRVEAAWQLTPGRIVGELKDAFFRAQGLHREARSTIETQLIAPLQALDTGRPLLDQAERAPRAIEQVAYLWGAVFGTGVTTEEGWQDVAARLLVIGAPDSPAPNADAIASAKGGAHPVTSWLTHVRSQPGAPTSGVLGLFPDSAIRTLHPRLAGISLRLASIDPSALLPLLQKYDAAAIRKAVSRYGDALAKAAGSKVETTPQEKALLDEALTFLDKLRETLAVAIKHQHPFVVRRLTEVEAAGSGRLGPLRSALKN